MSPHVSVTIPTELEEPLAVSSSLLRGPTQHLLTTRLTTPREHFQSAKPPPEIFFDGPNASPLAGILAKGELAVMVASGSGVTPFQGVIR